MSDTATSTLNRARISAVVRGEMERVAAQLLLMETLQSIPCPKQLKSEEWAALQKEVREKFIELQGRFRDGMNAELDKEEQTETPKPTIASLPASAPWWKRFIPGD